ncbi:MAG: TetR/AcrR family transcriptional regulator [Longimicrobiaceae bacterium]
MSEPRTARYDEKLESILHTAAGIFADKGYHRASIRDIARGTKVSLSGLYYYFDSKEELLFLIQDHAFGTLLERLERRLEGVDDPRERLRLLVENHLRFFAENMAEMKVLSHEARSLSGDYRSKVNAKKQRLTDTAMEIVRGLKPAAGVDLRVATFGLFGMMNWLYNWYRPGVDVPVETLAGDVTSIFLDGYQRDGLPGRKESPPGETAGK